MSEKPNPPAFPSCVEYFPKDKNYRDEQGMTLRDYFAAAALQGYIHADNDTSGHEEGYARCAYKMADAMLKERERD